MHSGTDDEQLGPHGHGERQAGDARPPRRRRWPPASRRRVTPVRTRPAAPARPGRHRCPGSRRCSRWRSWCRPGCARATTRAAAARHQITEPWADATAVPTTTGTTATGRVRGRAPATQRFTTSSPTDGAPWRGQTTARALPRGNRPPRRPGLRRRAAGGVGRRRRRPAGRPAAGPARPGDPARASWRPPASSGPRGRDRLRRGRPVDAGDALVVATSGTTGSAERGRAHPPCRDGIGPGDPRPARRRAGPAPVAGLPAPQPRRRSVRGDPGPPHRHAARGAGRVRPRTRCGPRPGPRCSCRWWRPRSRRVGADPFHTVVLGGSAPPPGLAANVVTTYGMTETGSGVVYDGVPLDGVEVSFAPARPRSGCGGPCCCGPTGTARRRSTPDGWLATGDAGHLDAAGLLHVDGRLSDLIVTGGENVWPAAVEAVLRRHPGRRPGRGRRPARPGVGPAGGRLGRPLRDRRPAGARRPAPPGQEQLGAWAAPRELILVESLPRTAIGKVRRDALT